MSGIFLQGGLTAEQRLVIAEQPTAAQRCRHAESGTGALLDGVLFHSRLEVIETLDGPLHIRIQVLDTHADTVETQSRQVFYNLFVDRPRIHFDGKFPALVLAQAEAFLQRAHDAIHLFSVEESGRAPAPVELAHPPVPIEQATLEFDLPAQVIHINFRFFRMAGDDLGAGTVITKRATERDMHIQRQRFGNRIVITHLSQPRVTDIVQIFGEFHRSWIRRITRSQFVVATNEVPVQFDLCHERVPENTAIRGHSSPPARSAALI